MNDFLQHPVQAINWNRVQDQKDDEVWKDVVEWEGRYFVSSHGRVISRKWSKTRKEYTERFLKLRPGAKGHLRVALCATDRSREAPVHILVLEAFVGPRPEGMHGLHWDDDPTNNHLSNLRWGSPSDNMFDRVRNGKHFFASKTHCKRGHELSGANLYASEGGPRCCVSCRFGRKKASRDPSKTIQQHADYKYHQLMKEETLV